MAGNFGVTSGVVSVTVDNPGSPPLPAGLVAGYGFSEGAGTATVDVTGNGNTATLMNGAVWSAGKYGSGVRLDGANDFLEVANSPSVNLSGVLRKIDGSRNESHWAMNEMIASAASAGLQSGIRTFQKMRK